MIFILSLFALAYSSDCIPPSDCSSYCRIQYSGLKNYYNSTDGNCYTIVKCNSTQNYDISSNSCINPSVVPNIPPSHLYGSNNITNSTNSTINNTTNKIIECIHGTFQGNVCICDNGYYTSMYQDPTQPTVKFCDTTDPQNATYSTGSNGELYLNSQAGNPYLQVPLNPIYKLIILLCFFFISCFLSCCYVKKIKKAYNSV